MLPIATTQQLRARERVLHDSVIASRSQCTISYFAWNDPAFLAASGNVRGRLGLRVGTTSEVQTGTTMEPFIIASAWGP